MTITAKLDLYLQDNLQEIKQIVTEAGAEDTWIIRGSTATIMQMDIRGRRIALEIPDAGTLFIARFPATDGEAPGISTKC